MTKKPFIVKRICAGLYELRQTIDGRLCVVTITHRADLKGWIAAATWDRFTYTDPVRTKWEAVHNGEMMLAERAGFDVPNLDRADA